MAFVRPLFSNLGPLALRAARPFVRPRHVILHGFYGAGNVGDEALLKASLEQLRALPSGLTPFVFCQHPERVEADHGVPCLNPARVGRKRLAAVLLRSEAYLLGGGGLLKDYGDEGARSMEKQWLEWLDLARRAGLKTMLWSVGVENVRYERSKRALRDTLRHVDVVTVRDEPSKARLREVGVARPVHVTADPVPWLARRYARLRTQPVPLRVIVSMRHWYPYAFEVPDDAVNERMIGAVAHALDHLVERYGAGVEFVPFRTSVRDDDREACRAVMQRMRTGATLYDEGAPGVEATMERVSAAHLVIGMRLHASVLATSMGIPTIAIAYMPKVRDYMASIGQSKLSLEIECVTEERLVAAVGEVLTHYDEYAKEVLAATAQQAERFRRNGDLLANLLKGQGSVRPDVTMPE